MLTMVRVQNKSKMSDTRGIRQILQLAGKRSEKRRLMSLLLIS